MKVLDLFSGLGGWSAAFKDRGHTVFTVDVHPDFKPDLCADIMQLTKEDIPFHPDIILASPPCQAFSVASIGRHWHKEPGKAPQPKTETAIQGIALVKHTLRLIQELNPKMWVMENPRGMLRKHPVMKDLAPPITVTYCQYGETRMKPTDLWGGHPRSIMYRPACSAGDICHEAAPRGSRAGTQNLRNAAIKALIPYDLSLSVCMAAELDLRQEDYK